MATLAAAGADPSGKVLTRACVLIVFGGIFDLLDGRVARLTERFSDFGVQLDSIADIVGFGVAPALLAWNWKLHQLGTLGVFITFFWVVCAAFRLARFNVEATKKDSTWQYKGYEEGLTSTMAGGALVSFVWVANTYGRDTMHVTAAHVAILAVSLALLMISSFPMADFRDLRRNRFARHITAVFLAACLTGLLFDPSMLFGIGAALYLSYSMAEGTFAIVRRRKVARTAGGASVIVDEDDFLG